MTKDDLLRLLLASADDTARVFDHAEVSTWPLGAREEFLRMGLLRAAQTGLTAPCPDCAEPHIEPVIVVGAPGKPPRYFIWCPESLRVEVTPAMCLGWEVDPGGLGKMLAATMKLGSPQVVLPGRLWRLGRTPWQGSTRQVVLALRLGHDDAAQVARHVGQGGRDIVLVPHQIPDDRLWPARVPAVVALSRVATIEGQSLVLDTVAMAEMVAEADKASAATNLVSMDQTGKKLVRRQVKAEIKSLVADDALVAAYQTNGSYRKAADALIEQGFPTDRWAVERAVKRAGGRKAVIAQKDSASVGRSVASQRRDRGKKIEQYRK